MLRTMRSLLDSRYAYPVVTYTWGAKSGSFVGDYYDSGTSGLNDLKVAYYTEENGVYYLHAVSREVSDFTMATDYRLVVYEISNIYGEKQYIYFEYSANGVNDTFFSVTDDEAGSGTMYDSGTLEEGYERRIARRGGKCDGVSQRRELS